jgi:hypothetical protein
MVGLVAKVYVKGALVLEKYSRNGLDKDIQKLK